jgi:CHRD domain
MPVPRLKSVLVVAVIGLLAASLVALGGPGAASDFTKFIKLTGEEEVPGPGDEDGLGRARITIKDDRERVCFGLRWKKLDPVIAAHIHVGEEGEAGDIVVTLFTAGETGLTTLSNTWTRLRACTETFSPPEGVTVAELLDDIEENPENYYVNVHTTTFPAGAIRGQLADDKDS